jgi:hypothetical protein
VGWWAGVDQISHSSQCENNLSRSSQGWSRNCRVESTLVLGHSRCRNHNLLHIRRVETSTLVAILHSSRAFVAREYRSDPHSNPLVNCYSYLHYNPAQGRRRRFFYSKQVQLCNEHQCRSPLGSGSEDIDQMDRLQNFGHQPNVSALVCLHAQIFSGRPVWPQPYR